MKKTLTVVIILSLLVLDWRFGPRWSHADSSTTTRLYDASGNELMGYHEVVGSVNLVAGTATVTLSGKAVFTSSTSYNCAISDMSSVSATSVIRNSGSSITFNGLLTDTIGYICAGN